MELLQSCSEPAIYLYCKWCENHCIRPLTMDAGGHLIIPIFKWLARVYPTTIIYGCNKNCVCMWRYCIRHAWHENLMGYITFYGCDGLNLPVTKTLFSGVLTSLSLLTGVCIWHYRPWMEMCTTSYDTRYLSHQSVSSVLQLYDHDHTTIWTKVSVTRNSFLTCLLSGWQVCCQFQYGRLGKDHIYVYVMILPNSLSLKWCR